VRLWSRNGRDWSAEFVAITAPVRALPFKRIMIDGEAVAHCLDGLPDFHGLLGDGQASACLYAFDLLLLETQDVRGIELIGRRRILQKALRKAAEALRFSEHLEGADGPAMYRHACRMGLEGIVSKRLDSRYRSGRCASWRKVKNPAYERR
jgi:bifunctional non-homologous end joining protein LigD